MDGEDGNGLNLESISLFLTSQDFKKKLWVAVPAKFHLYLLHNSIAGFCVGVKVLSNDLSTHGIDRAGLKLPPHAISPNPKNTVKVLSSKRLLQWRNGEKTEKRRENGEKGEKTGQKREKRSPFLLPIQRPPRALIFSSLQVLLALFQHQRSLCGGEC